MSEEVAIPGTKTRVVNKILGLLLPFRSCQMIRIREPFRLIIG